MVNDSGQNIYKLYFLEIGKIEYSKNITFIKNNKLLKIFLMKDWDLFYYSNFISKNTFIITNKNISKFLKLLIHFFDTENKLSLIYSNKKLSLHYSIKMQHKF